MSTAKTFPQKLLKSKRDARYRARHYEQILRKQRERQRAFRTTEFNQI